MPDLFAHDSHAQSDPFAMPSRKGLCGRAAALHCGGLRCATASLRCSVLRPRCATRCVHCVHSAQTSATSQFTIRAAREAASPALLGATEARCVPPAQAYAARDRWWFDLRRTRRPFLRTCPVCERKITHERFPGSRSRAEGGQRLPRGGHAGQQQQLEALRPARTGLCGAACDTSATMVSHT